MSRHLWTTIWAWLKTSYRPSFSSRRTLLRWQDRKIVRHIKRTVGRSEFYRDLYADFSLESWRGLPSINKQTMMENFDRFNTVGLTIEDALQRAHAAERPEAPVPDVSSISVGLSTGTSGHRGVFVTSAAERARWAGIIIAKVLPGFATILSGHTIALFLRSNNALYETLTSRKIKFHYFNIFEPLSSLVSQLNRLKPSVLVAPPSTLERLARSLASSDLKIAPQRIISVAEVLDPLTKWIVEEAFGKPLHQIYQATEGLLGTTCSHGTIHILEEHIAMEKDYLDSQKSRFVPIITDFTRTSQPILRYRLDDVLLERESPCPCGAASLAIESIEGRVADIFYFPDQQTGEMHPVFPGEVTDAILKASDKLEDFGVLQTAHSIGIFLVCGDEETTRKSRIEVQSGIEQLLWARNCVVPEIEWMDEWPFHEDVKRRRVVRQGGLPTPQMKQVSRSEP